MLHALVVSHDILARALVLMAILLGLYGGYEFLRHRRTTGGFRSGYLLMCLLVVIQGIAGALALLTGGHPKELLHIVYGIFAVLFLPGVYVYSRDRKPDTEAAILTIACWVVVIAYLRGFATA